MQEYKVISEINTRYGKKITIMDGKSACVLSENEWKYIKKLMQQNKQVM